MKRKRHSPEKIIRKLREADRMQSEGKDIAVVRARTPGGVIGKAREGLPMSIGRPVRRRKSPQVQLTRRTMTVRTAQGPRHALLGPLSA